MCNYLNDKGEKSESHYFMDMRYLLTDLQRHYASKCDDDGSTFFMNFITSTLTICINQAFNSLGINNNNNNNIVSKFDGCAHHLDDDSRNETLDYELDSFRPLYYPGITHLLSCLNVIRSCQRGGYVHDQLGEKKGVQTTYDLLALDSRELLTENIGNFCASMLKGRGELLSLLDDKLSVGGRMDAGHGFENIIHRNVFRNNIASGGGSCHGSIVEYQTKCYVAQVLLDVYKVTTMEMHRRADHAGVSDDVFDRCVTCTNAALMKGEYQAMVDSVRESLPLNRGTGHVTFHEDHARHELIKY